MSVFVVYFFSKKGPDHKEDSGRWGKLFLTWVVTVMGEKTFRDCRWKQKGEDGLWEPVAHAERALRGPDRRRTQKAKV